MEQHITKASTGGVYPDTKYECWDIPECKIEDKDVEPRSYLNGIMFLPDGETGN